VPPTKWYSGYLHIPGGKHLHYIFVESPNPTTDPVTAWFNGGPGCSSLEGLFAELGQLLVVESAPSTLAVNPNSWANISSTLFIEAPACVGYSYADTIDGCTHNDSSQAVDNHNAVKYFFSQYPEFSANKFFVTGESYAGIYVPTLAKEIVLGNAAGQTPLINLVGIMVGNGCLGLNAGLCSFDNGVEINTNIPFLRGHALVSTPTWTKFNADCPIGTDPTNPSQACLDDITQAHNEVGNINIYDVNTACIDGPPSGVVRSDKVYTRAPVSKRLGGPIECIDETISVYIGSQAVANALNVISSLHWAVCGSNASFTYDRTEMDERVDVYPFIVAAGVQIMIYNGCVRGPAPEPVPLAHPDRCSLFSRSDADACVPWIDNECVCGKTRAARPRACSSRTP
jgi:hypothetical protein